MILSTRPNASICDGFEKPFRLCLEDRRFVGFDDRDESKIVLLKPHGSLDLMQDDESQKNLESSKDHNTNVMGYVKSTHRKGRKTPYKPRGPIIFPPGLKEWACKNANTIHPMIEELEKSLAEANTVVVSGYGGQDMHINDLFVKWARSKCEYRRQVVVFSRFPKDLDTPLLQSLKKWVPVRRVPYWTGCLTAEEIYRYIASTETSIPPQWIRLDALFNCAVRSSTQVQQERAASLLS